MVETRVMAAARLHDAPPFPPTGTGRAPPTEIVIPKFTDGIPPPDSISYNGPLSGRNPRQPRGIVDGRSSPFHPTGSGHAVGYWPDCRIRTGLQARGRGRSLRRALQGCRDPTSWWSPEPRASASGHAPSVAVSVRLNHRFAWPRTRRARKAQRRSLPVEHVSARARITSQLRG